jgi:hypothetical protein
LKTQKKGDHAVSEKNQRQLDELKARAQPALKDPNLVAIASTFKPNSSYKSALEATGDPTLAKACRWLSIIYRDHGEDAFQEFVKKGTATVTEKTKS